MWQWWKLPPYRRQTRAPARWAACTSLLFLAGGGPIHDYEVRVNQIHTHSGSKGLFSEFKIILRDVAMVISLKTHYSLIKKRYYLWILNAVACLDQYCFPKENMNVQELKSASWNNKQLKHRNKSLGIVTLFHCLPLTCIFSALSFPFPFSKNVLNSSSLNAWHDSFAFFHFFLERTSTTARSALVLWVQTVALPRSALADKQLSLSAVFAFPLKEYLWPWLDSTLIAAQSEAPTSISTALNAAPWAMLRRTKSCFKF